MAVDYRAKEDAFLRSLDDDTGRDLRAWMQAIAEQNFEQRNDTIDWLRRQGFTFSKASWLERIHNNGGVPIYATGTRAGSSPKRHASVKPSAHDGDGPLAPRPAAANPTGGLRLVVDNSGDVERPAPPAAVEPQGIPRAQTTAVTSPHALHSAAIASSAEAITAALQGAKAYRPLAIHIIDVIERDSAQVTTVADGKLLVFHTETGAFAGLLLNPKGLTLALAANAARQLPPFETDAKPAGFARFPAQISHSLRLDDARQITPELRAAIATAVAETQG